MADVELILKVDNIPAITSIKETELALAELNEAASGGGEDRVTLLKKELSVLGEFKKKTQEATISEEDYNEALEDTTQNSEKASASIGGMGKKLGGIAAIVTLVVTGLRSLATAFKETTAGFNTMTKAGSVFRQIMYDIVTLNLKNGDSLKKGLEIAKLEINLRRQQIADIKSLANYQVLYNKYMADANNNSKTAKDRMTALSSATEMYNSIMNKKVANAREEWLIANDDLSMKPQNHKLQEKTNKLYAAYVLLQQEQILNNDALKQQAEGINQIQLDKYFKEIEAANEAYDKRLELQKKFQDLSVKLLDEYIQTEIQSLQGPARLAAERDYALKTIEAFRKEMEAFGNLTQEQKKMFNELGEKIWGEFYKGLEEGSKMSEDDTARFVDLVLTNLGAARAKLQTGLVASNNKYPEGKKKETIWDLFGLSPEQGEAAKAQTIESVNNLVYEISKSLDTLYAKRVDDAERNVALLDRQLSFKQTELEAELRLAELGYANNVDLKRREVNAINAEREKALVAQENALKKQQKYEALAQAIALTSSAAQIIYEAIKEYKLYGLIVAGLEIAGLWVAWDSYKQQAKDVTMLAEGGSGDSTGMIKGRSHSQGGEHFLDHVEVEGGEKWGVLNKRASGKYGEAFDYMVDSFNRDTFPDIMPQVTNSVNIDNNGPNSRLDKVIAEQRKLNEKYGKEAHVSVIGGKKVITRGNKVRIVG